LRILGIRATYRVGTNDTWALAILALVEGNIAQKQSNPSTSTLQMQKGEAKTLVFRRSKLELAGSTAVCRSSKTSFMHRSSDDVGKLLEST